jgi:type II secretory pathway component PulF
MMNEKSKAAGMSEELWAKLTNRLYTLYQRGVPVSKAIKIGKIIVENYWRDKNADKSGG